MRIVLDLQSCQSGSRLGGIGRYSMSLAKAMIREPRGHEFWVVLNSLLPASIRDVRRDLTDLLPPDRICVIELPGPAAEGKPENRVRLAAAKLMRGHFIRELQPDLVHVTSMIEGFYEDVVTSVGSLWPAERTVATLYDLIPYVQQEVYLNDPATREHYLAKVEAIRNTGLLLSISEYSRQEAIELLGRHPDSVVNMSSAIEPYFRPVAILDEDAAALRAKYGIRHKFLMYTSSFDARKNQQFLVRAFATLPARLRADYQVVIVGNGWDGAYALLRNAGVEAGLAPNDLVFTGHAPDEDLLRLYNLCSLFVFPSLREGFGLPILEAMSCGTPAIGSDSTSIPEVIGMKEALFDPKDISSIGRKLFECLSDRAFYRHLVDHSRKQAARFSWERSAEVALEAMEAHHARLSTRPGARRGAAGAVYLGTPNAGYRELVGALARIEGIGTAAADARSMAQSLSRNLATLEGILRARQQLPSPLRIGWVTTWNTKCGIATYTIPVMKAMPACHTIFAPHETSLLEPDSDNVVRCWKAGGNDSLTTLREAIDGHDIDVLVVQFNYGFYEPPALSALLDEQAARGRAVVVILHSTQDPRPEILDRKLAQLKDAFAGCRLLVHSVLDVGRLKALGLEENVSLIPLGMHEDRPAAVSLASLSGKTVIGTYGFALPNKGLAELLDAFVLLARENAQLHLLMVNAEYPAPESRSLLQSIRERVAAGGLASRVTLMTDYLTNEDSIGYLQCADLIVIPYQDSTESSSGSVRMSLAAGRPVAVTPLKLFDDVKSAVLALPGTGVQEIAAGIRQLLADLRSNGANIGQARRNARSWVRAHGFSGVGRYLFSTLMAMQEERPPTWAGRAARKTSPS